MQNNFNVPTCEMHGTCMRNACESWLLVFVCTLLYIQNACDRARFQCSVCMQNACPLYIYQMYVLTTPVS